MNIGKRVVTPVQKVAQTRQKVRATKVRKRLVNVHFSDYGNELTNIPLEATHVEFYARTAEGIRFSVDGHFAVIYSPERPEIELYISDVSFDKVLKLNDQVKCFVFSDIDFVQDEVFEYVDANKDLFLLK